MKYFDIVNNKTGLLHATLQESLVATWFAASKWNKKFYVAVERDPKKKSKFTHEMSRAGRDRQYGPV